jgi:hypothetical protein
MRRHAGSPLRFVEDEHLWRALLAGGRQNAPHRAIYRPASGYGLRNVGLEGAKEQLFGRFAASQFVRLQVELVGAYGEEVETVVAAGGGSAPNGGVPLRQPRAARWRNAARLRPTIRCLRRGAHSGSTTEQDPEGPDLVAAVHDDGTHPGNKRDMAAHVAGLIIGARYGRQTAENESLRWHPATRTAPRVPAQSPY